MSSFTYVLLIAALCIADSMQTPFEPCDGGLPVPKSVKIVGCTKLPCDLKRGEAAVGEIKFAVVADTKTLTPKVNAQVGSINTPFPLPEKNACKNLIDAECPLDKGEVVTYKLSMPVRKIYPTGALTIQLSLEDDQGKSQSCFKLPSQVVN
ncbi:NPC intracellular cholesterol transporter 2 [Halictus rubicundus]|uniref:NPC intracellular cholesterol transporter 2 n=1 Tax=Halictus rubicundus TaxID=77578 RepID=UPI004036AFB6